MDANLVRRVGFAVVAIPLALLLVWYGGLPLVLLLVAGRARSRPGSCSISPSGSRSAPARALGLVSAAAISPIAYAAIASPGTACRGRRGLALRGGALADRHRSRGPC